MRISILLLVVGFLFSGCDKEKRQLKKDDEKILDYLMDNDADAEKHESGLYYSIIAEGNGEYPSSVSDVEVRYKGYFLDGNIFDQTKNDATYKFNLSGNVIEGWKIGVPLISKGGKGILYIPSSLGYGSEDFYTIPGNSVLIFEVELVDFK